VRKHAVASVVGCALTVGGVVHAQQSPAPAAPPKTAAESPSPRAVGVPLRVQVVLSRYEGERKVSSLPYALVVNAMPEGMRALSNIDMTAKVPVPSASPGPPTYHDIGTKISCYAVLVPDGRYQVSVTVSDTSVYGDGQTPKLGSTLPDIPSFRSFGTSETVTLKDGQTAQFTAATDKLSGETTKVDVTLSVLR
jgi:hypothetical protein